MSKFQRAFDVLMEEMLDDMFKHLQTKKVKSSEPEESAEEGVATEQHMVKNVPFYAILHQFVVMFETDSSYEPNVEYQAFRTSDPDHYITMIQGVKMEDGKKVITPTLLFWEGDDCEEWEPEVDDLFASDWNLVKVTFEE